MSFEITGSIIIYNSFPFLNEKDHCLEPRNRINIHSRWVNLRRTPASSWPWRGRSFASPASAGRICSPTFSLFLVDDWLKGINFWKYDMGILNNSGEKLRNYSSLNLILIEHKREERFLVTHLHFLNNDSYPVEIIFNSGPTDIPQCTGCISGTTMNVS